MSWVEGAEGCPFGVTNLPFGSFPAAGGPQRLGVRIGEWVLDVGEVARQLDHPDAQTLGAAELNPFLAAGPTSWERVRGALTSWVTDRAFERVCRPSLHALAGVELRLPFVVGDYVDFYSCAQHASNAARIFRPTVPDLPPAWRHQPIGYHGRSGSVVVSGTPVVRPRGQWRRAGQDLPSFGPTGELDFEAEVGFVVGVGAHHPVPLREWRAHVFGVCLVNDWSARDLQAFEAIPLGPFLAKSFLTSVSPWVVPIAALETARTEMPARTTALSEYLDDTGEEWGFDLRLEVAVNGEVVSRPPFSSMYWSPAQQLAHLTVNGATVRTGDLYASGTVSGPERNQWGSMLELSWRGETPVRLGDGSTRAFLEDGDVVTITAHAPGPGGGVIGLGEVTGTVLAA